MAGSKIKEISHRIAQKCDTLVFGPKKQNNYVLWIITRYLYYMTLAIIHGYKITVWRRCKIGLVWSPPMYLNVYTKRRYVFSPMVFDHMFSLSIEGKNIDNVRMSFYLDRKLKKRIEEKLSTDAVYQFIKQ